MRINPLILFLIPIAAAQTGDSRNEILKQLDRLELA